MANKLREVFSKKESYINGAIKFNDTDSRRTFITALETVFKEGKTIGINGVDGISMRVESGTGTLPVENYTNVTDILVGPSKEPFNIKLECNGEIIDFTLSCYKIEKAFVIETPYNFIISTKIIVEEETNKAKISIRPEIEKASDVESVLKSICIEEKLLKDYFFASEDQKENLDMIFEYLSSIRELFDKLRFIENTFNIKFIPAAININEGESQRDLYEIYLLLIEKKVVRINAKITDTISGNYKFAQNETPIEGKEISMTFIGNVEYYLWGQKLKLYSANLVNNVVVNAVETLEDGQFRILYRERESNPMYISYRGFITEEEAREELKHIMNSKDEYINAKTISQYMLEVSKAREP